HQFDEAHLADKIKEYYAANPTAYTQIGHDRWEPHYMYIGEVVEAIEG
ncbi:MAG: flavin reductase, partial [Veillonella sp.]|nr:flavin reductase [Veillonella sp.]